MKHANLNLRSNANCSLSHVGDKATQRPRKPLVAIVDSEGECNHRANPTPIPAQARLIAHDLKSRQTQKAMILNLEALGPYDFYITLGANPSVLDPQEFQIYLKRLLKAMNNNLMEKVVNPDINPLSNKASVLLGYVTVEYHQQFYAHITFRIASGLKQYTLDELVDVFMASSKGIGLNGLAVPVFNPIDCSASLTIDLGGSEALAYHNLALISGQPRNESLSGIYRLFGRKLERLL